MGQSITPYHHDHHEVECSLMCVWKARDGFPDRVRPKTVKWIVYILV